MPYFVGLASIAVQSTAVDFMIRVSERLSCTAPSVANTAMPATTKSLVLTKVILPLRLSKPVMSVEPARNAAGYESQKLPGKETIRRGKPRAASGTTAPTPGRPYRAFHFSRVVPVPPWRIPRSFLIVSLRYKSPEPFKLELHEIRGVQFRDRNGLFPGKTCCLEPLNAVLVHRMQKLSKVLMPARHARRINTSGGQNCERILNDCRYTGSSLQSRGAAPHRAFQPAI